MSTQPIRIYLVGSHSTGKTTLARYVRDSFGLPMLSEVARTVLAELETDLDRLRADLDAVGRYQKEVFHRQVDLERRFPAGFVSDRAFCNLAYAAHHTTIAPEILRSAECEQYLRWVSGGLVFFVRPHRELMAEDGTRAGLDWREIVTIDGMVKMLLEMFAIPYIPIESLSMQERVRTIENVVSMRSRILELEQQVEKLASRLGEEVGQGVLQRRGNGAGSKSS